MRRRPRLAAALLVCVPLAPALLAGCSGGGSSDETSSAPTQAELAARLQKARTTLDDARSLNFSIKTARLPSGVTGLLSASGVGNHEPAFKGDVTVSSGTSIDASVVAVDGQVYAKTGFAPVYVPVDPASLGSPDPAELMRADGGITTVLTESEDLRQGDQSRDGSDVLTTLTGTVPGAVVHELIPTADASAAFDASYRLDDADVLRDATLRGPFYPGDTPVTYTIEVTASDQSVDIAKP